jgi:hypothetical protein
MNAALHPMSRPLTLRHAAKMPLMPATRPLKSISRVAAKPMSAPPIAADIGVKFAIFFSLFQRRPVEKASTWSVIRFMSGTIMSKLHQREYLAFENSCQNGMIRINPRMSMWIGPIAYMSNWMCIVVRVLPSHFSTHWYAGSSSRKAYS